MLHTSKPSERFSSLSAVPHEHVEGKSLAQRIADIMIDRTAISGSCTEAEILEHGISAADLDAHGAEAKAIARAEWTRRTEPAQRTPEQGAAIIRAHLPSEAELFGILRRDGWSVAQINQHWQKMWILVGAELSTAVLQ